MATFTHPILAELDQQAAEVCDLAERLELALAAYTATADQLPWGLVGRDPRARYLLGLGQIWRPVARELNP